jgi:hypothetical protein
VSSLSGNRFFSCSSDAAACLWSARNGTIGSRVNPCDRGSHLPQHREYGVLLLLSDMLREPEVGTKKPKGLQRGRKPAGRSRSGVAGPASRRLGAKSSD